MLESSLRGSALLDVAPKAAASALDAMKIEIAGDSCKSEWNQFLRGTPHHFFHYFEWADIFRQAYGFRPLYLAVRNQAGELLAAHPLFQTESVVFGRSLKSFPYHIEGGTAVHPQIADKTPVYRLIASQIIDLQKQVSARNIDVRFSDRSFFTAVDGGRIRVYDTYARYILDIRKGSDALLRGFRRDVRNNIRRAANFGVRVEIPDKAGDIDTFYRLYAFWSKGIGLPGHSEKFFKLIWDVFYPKGMAKIAVASMKGTPVAAKLFLIDPSDGSVLQNWGGLRDFGLKKYQLNTALYWHEIQWSVFTGHKTFDLGVTSQFDLGSHYFKAGWGCDRRDVYFCNMGDFSRTALRDDHNAGRLFRFFWKKAGLPLIRHLGPRLLRHGN